MTFLLKVPRPRLAPSRSDLEMLHTLAFQHLLDILLAEAPKYLKRSIDAP